MRCVRNELPLRVERRLEAREKLVEGGAELLQLVVRAVEGEPPVQVAGGDLARCVRDRPQRLECAARDEPAEPDRDDGHDCEREAGFDHQRVQRGVRLLPGLGHNLGRRGQPQRVARHAQAPSYGPARADEEVAVVEAVRDEDVRDRQQHRAGDQEEAAVEQRQPQADRVARPGHGAIR